jgi:Domain of unknown function (DUF4136)
MRVRAAMQPGADIPRYATYAWASRSLRELAPARGDAWRGVGPGAEAEEIDLDDRVRAEVDAELRRRGYALSRGGADLLVDYRISTHDTRYDESPGSYTRYRSEGGTGEWGQVYVEGYEEGTLALLIADARTRRPLWHASATAVVNPELRAQRIPEAIRKMFAEFPSRATGVGSPAAGG